MIDLSNIQSFELNSLQKYEVEEILLVLVFKSKINMNMEYTISLKYVMDFYMSNYYSTIVQ